MVQYMYTSPSIIFTDDKLIKTARISTILHFFFTPIHIDNVYYNRFSGFTAQNSNYDPKAKNTLLLLTIFGNVDKQFLSLVRKMCRCDRREYYLCTII